MSSKWTLWSSKGTFSSLKFQATTLCRLTLINLFLFVINPNFHPFSTNRKNLLNETTSLGDFTTNDHTNIQRRIDGALKGIQPSDEYKEFTEKYKSLPVIFRFDDNPIDDNVGKLQPNQLTVDNLTVEWLRQRIAELENLVKECQEKQAKFDLNGRISSSSTSLPLTPTSANNVIANNCQPQNGSNGNLKDNK